MSPSLTFINHVHCMHSALSAEHTFQVAWHLCGIMVEASNFRQHGIAPFHKALHQGQSMITQNRKSLAVFRQDTPYHSRSYPCLHSFTVEAHDQSGM